MQDKKLKIDARWLKIALVAAGAILLCALYYRQLGTVMSVLVTGLVMAFLLAPVCEVLSKWGLRNRALVVTCAFAVVILALAGLILLALPPLIQQLRELSNIMGQSTSMLQEMLGRLNAFLIARLLPPIDLASIDWSWLSSGLSGILNGTRDFAGNMIGVISRFGFALMLAFYFLLDKEPMLFSAELWIPSSARKLVLQMAANVTRELRQYIKGQLTIASIVGILAGIGLLMVGAPSPLLLGVLIGAFNLIPYFGPLIGAIPAVLMALGQGLNTAVLTALVLFVVQQLDGFVISPRVMSGMMGLSPPGVLLAITLGSSISGISGMFFAIPVLLIVRICLRVWASRNEVIEKYPEV